MTTLGVVGFGRVAASLLRRALLVIMVGALVGCATSSMDLKPGGSVAKGGTVVFGRVAVYQNDKEIKWADDGTSLFGRNFRLCVLAGEDTDCLKHAVASDGSFCWPLVPGQYAIAGFEWAQGSYMRSGRTWCDFEVPATGRPVYIGTLVIRFAGGGYRFDVEAESERAQDWFRSKYPSLSGETLMNLMRVGVNP